MEGIDPLCAANLNAGVNVSGIRKIGNRFLIPRENSSFTLVSTLDRRTREVSGEANRSHMGGRGDVLLFRSKRLKLMRRVRVLFGDSFLFLIRKLEREFYREFCRFT